jgi:hypothetical protein
VTATGPDGVRRPFGLLAATVAGIALASLPRGTGPIALWVGGLVGSTCAVWAAHPSSLPASAAGARVDPAERVARFLPLVCLLPVLTMPVAPGADMAMHVALARALSGGATELSVAWPGVAPPLYPRGFSGLIALFWSLGPGRAGLLASGLAYVLYALGAARLFTALGMKRPYTVAAITLFLAKTPQDVFAWGGNATVLALALGLHAAASLAAPAADRRTGVSAGLLLSGAGAVHPMGALIGAIVAGATTVRARAWGPGVTALGALAVTLTLIALAGPTLSAAEREWIVNWGRTREAVLRAAPWQFPLSVWLAFPRVLGVPWTAAVLLAASCLVLASPGRKLVGRVVAGVLSLGAILAVVPVVPALGTLLYPVRLLPLLALVTAPLLDAALARFPARAASVGAGLLLALAAPFHVGWYQRARPMVTAADLGVLACAAARTPGDAVIAGAYGDATQWVPALSGRRVTLPHRHVSVLDETRPALDALRPTHRLAGERRLYPPAFPGPDPGPEPTTAPLCQEGAARVWRLDG